MSEKYANAYSETTTQWSQPASDELPNIYTKTKNSSIYTPPHLNNQKNPTPSISPDQRLRLWTPAGPNCGPAPASNVTLHPLPLYGLLRIDALRQSLGWKLFLSGISSIGLLEKNGFHTRVRIADFPI